MRLPVSIFVVFCLAAPAVASAQSTSWSAGGTISAAWAGGWPVLDLHGRAGWLVAGGHELGFGSGLSSQRLGTVVSVEGEYTHTWLADAVWPFVTLHSGIGVDLVGFMAQLRYVLGTSIGLRVPLGERLLLRCELRYERSMTAYWTDRLGLSIGLEAIRGPRWGTVNEEQGM